MKNEKPIYLIPELEVVRFPQDDILSTSGISLHGSDAEDLNDNTGEGSIVDVGQLFPGQQ